MIFMARLPLRVLLSCYRNNFSGKFERRDNEQWLSISTDD